MSPPRREQCVGAVFSGIRKIIISSLAQGPRGSHIYFPSPRRGNDIRVLRDRQSAISYNADNRNDDGYDHRERWAFYKEMRYAAFHFSLETSLTGSTKIPGAALCSPETTILSEGVTPEVTMAYLPTSLPPLRGCTLLCCRRRLS